MRIYQGKRLLMWISVFLAVTIFGGALLGLYHVHAAQNSVTISFARGGNWDRFINGYTNENNVGGPTDSDIKQGTYVGPRTAFWEQKDEKIVFKVSGKDPGIFLDFSHISGGLAIGSDYVVVVNYAVVDESFKDANGETANFTGQSEIFFWGTDEAILKPAGADNPKSDPLTLDLNSTMNDHYAIISAHHQTNVGKIRIDIPAIGTNWTCEMMLHIKSIYIGPRSGSAVKKITYSYKNATADTVTATEYLLSGESPKAIPAVSTPARATNANVRYAFKNSWKVGSTANVTTENLKTRAITADVTIAAEYTTEYLYHFKQLTNMDKNTWKTGDLWVASGETPAPTKPGNINNETVSSRKVFTSWTPNLAVASSSNAGRTYTAQYRIEHLVKYHQYKSSFIDGYDANSPYEWVEEGKSPELVKTLVFERANDDGSARFYLQNYKCGDRHLTPEEIAQLEITAPMGLWGNWAKQYRVRYYKSDNKTVLASEWVNAGAKAPEMDGNTVSGKMFVSWLLNSKNGNAVNPAATNINAGTDFYPRYLSNAFVGADSNGLVYTRTVERFIPEGYTEATIPDSHHQYQIKIQFYFYKNQPEGPVKVVENFNSVFAVAGEAFEDEYAKQGIKDGKINVYREAYTGNGTFAAPIRLGAGNNGYNWEDVHFGYRDSDIRVANSAYYTPSEGNPEARKYEFFTFRFFDDSLDYLDKKEGNDSAYFRRRTTLNEVGNIGFRYTIVIDLELNRGRTIGGNNIPISFGENLPKSAFDPNSGRRILEDTDINTPAHGIKLYNSDCTRLLETKEFSDRENVNVEIRYDLSPHDYYMDLYDVEREKGQVYYGLLTAMTNEQTEEGRKQNRLTIYGNMFTHGNGPIFRWGYNSDTLPNTDCDKSRNSHVDLKYEVTLKNAHTNASGTTYPAGTVIYQTYCYGDDKFAVDTTTTDWFKKVKLDYSKDHTVMVTAIATPTSTGVDSFGRAPVGVKDGKVVGDTVVGESYFFSARYAVADYGLVITAPLQGESQKSGAIPTYLRTPSVKSGTSNATLKVTLSDPLAISQTNVAYSHFPDYTNRNQGNKLLRQMANGIIACDYETEVINPLKYRDLGVTDAKQTKVTRTVYIIPATTVMYDQDIVTFLTGLNGTRIQNYTTGNGPWKLTGDVYNGFQNSSSTVLYGYDSNVIKYETLGDHAKNGNNQLDFNGGSVYATVDGSMNASGTRVNQNQYGEFTFTGTGFDLYSRTGEDTGVIVAEIYNASGKKLRNILVDTYMKTFSVTSKVNSVNVTTSYDTLYQIPVITYVAPEYGTYTVKFRAYYHEIFDHYYGYTQGTTGVETNAAKRSRITEEQIRDLLGWEEDVPMTLELSYEMPDYRPTRGTESYKTDNAYNVYVDGIRIYSPLNQVKAHSYTPGENPNCIFGTAENAVSAAAHYIYSLAGEANPKYANLNDLLLDATNTDWCEDLYGDSDLDSGYVGDGVAEYNDVTGILFVTGQNTEKGAEVGQDDIHVGIHLGMSGRVLKEIVSHTEGGKKYEKHYLLHADGTYLLDPGTGMKIFWYSKNGNYYAETAVWTRLTDVQVYAAYDQEITFYDSKYKALGPANEIYLTDYNGIAFYLGKNLPDNVKVHLSIKSITGTRAIMRACHGTGDNYAWTTVITNAMDLRHRTEMYYDFSDYLYRDSDGGCYLFLQHANTGHGAIVSLTEVKFLGTETVTPKVNLRTVQLAQQFFAETPVDESLSLKHTLNLASDISLNYIATPDLMEGVTDSWVTVEIPVYEGNAKTGTRIETLRPEIKNYVYYYTLSGLTAVHMNDTLEAKLYVVRDGVTYVSETDTYSIATYAYGQLDKETAPPALKTLCAELLRYGGYAQIFKGYRTDALADSQMTEEHRALLGDLSTVTFGSNNAVLEDLEAPAVLWNGKALDLGSKVAVKFVFSLQGYEGRVEDLTLSVTYTAIDGQEKTAELTDPRIYNEVLGQYAFTFDGLLAAELRSVLYVRVCEKGIPLSQTMVYSPDTYGNGKNGILGDLCKALFSYSDAAKAYFNQ